MATNSEVVKDALDMLGVTDDITAPVEYSVKAMKRMNDMLANWENNEIDVGYFKQDTLTDDCPVNDEYLLAVKANLAVSLAPDFKAVVGPALASLAMSTYKELLRKEQTSRTEPVTTEHAPLGQNWPGRYNIFTDE